MIIIIATAERYMPPPILLSCSLVERTSLRKFFFSEELNFDLSIALIALSRASSACACADSADFVEDIEEEAEAPAMSWVGMNVNDRNVAIKHQVNFFILLNFISRNLAGQV
jgi:hypothetical protein